LGESKHGRRRHRAVPIRLQTTGTRVIVDVRRVISASR
jgi:hypothetical protein